MRTVLIATYHFPPSAAVAVHRMLGYARFLPKFGWQPVIVAPPRVPWEPEDKGLLAQIPEGTVVERIPFLNGFIGKAARRIAPLAHWLPWAWPACARLVREHRAEAVLTCGPPMCVHYLGMGLKKRFHIPWMASFRDPWVINRRPDTPMPLREKLEAPMEAVVLRQADVAVANTPLCLEGWRQAYPELAEKFVCIPNGFNPEVFQPLPPHDPRPKSRWDMLHTGELYEGRDPRPLLEALAAGPEKDSFHVEFVGRNTEGLLDINAEIRRLGLKDEVTLTGQIPHRQALAKLVAADVLVLIHTPDYRLGLPSKLFEYLGAGRPILALAEPDGDIAWVLKTSGVLHRIAPPRDVPRIRQALAELREELARGAGNLAPAPGLQLFTRENMARQVAQRLDHCLAAAVAVERVRSPRLLKVPS